jgi:signal transduction histidine kinase
MGNLSSQDIKSALGSVEAIAREGQSREVLQALPVAVYTTDAEGRITYFNDAAAELWGQKPELGTNEWCGSWRLDWPAALRDLGARTAEGKMAEEACAIAAQALAGHARDIPFALLYLVDEAGQRARLVGATGVGKGEAAAPVALELDRVAGRDTEWPLAEVLRSGTGVTVENLSRCFSNVPAGPWSDPPHTAVVVPIKSNIAHRLAGFLIAGASPRLKLDDHYRGFFDLAAAQIATAIANARSYEEERKRAEALAEIDRAKTLFFSNISHEFRTPLTLVIGPLKDALADASLPAVERVRLDIAHRNSLRLLKLVNALLDFSRVEAGRIEASYEPVDLSALTRDLASNFRAACEKAGLSLVIDCPPLAEPVYVDREMWEKIVLNLVSNAFKFTLEGEIVVRLRQKSGATELTVRDTGVGIQQADLPRVFERFYRVEGQVARTHEGSGIGLSLVRDLVGLHGGDVSVESTRGEGTTFAISIPDRAFAFRPDRRCSHGRFDGDPSGCFCRRGSSLVAHVRFGRRGRCGHIAHERRGEYCCREPRGRWPAAIRTRRRRQ